MNMWTSNLSKNKGTNFAIISLRVKQKEEFQNGNLIATIIMNYKNNDEDLNEGFIQGIIIVPLGTVS